jgi:AcrR family transcriptional regulator
VTQATKIPTRERIVAAAVELFRHQGYNGTGLKQILKAAEAPYGSLYHHFPGGKRQLAEEVIDRSGAFFEALVTGVYDTEESAEASVRAVFAGAATTLEVTGYEDACPIATIALEVASTDDVLRRATADVFERWRGALAQRLGDRDKALAVIAALEGAFLLCRAARDTAAMRAAGSMAASLVAISPGEAAASG